MAEDVASDRWGDEEECEGSVAGVKQGEGAEGAKEEPWSGGGLVQCRRKGGLRESLRGRFRLFRFGECRLVFLF